MRFKATPVRLLTTCVLVKTCFFMCVNTEFAGLLKLMWNSRSDINSRSGISDNAVSPVKFKDKVAEFAKRFVGYR